ncbi:MAG: argininosuccinate synthase [Flavobacteriales bacterium TMED96]|nr:MAG: argininosuccinate synthase [Flavobacteriales bacterium TMED96]
MKNNKVVLAYSGGLDTSFCLKKLIDEGFDVHPILINTGGFTKSDLKLIKYNSKVIGSNNFQCIDAEKDFYQKIIRFLVYGNILKNSTYPLSVSSERIIQAIEIIKYAKKIKASSIAHGSTGAGNDQVRFDLIFQILSSDIKVITPIRDNKISRDEEISFLKKNGIELNWDEKKYSINKGLWGTSIGGKETLGSRHNIPENAYPSKVNKKKEENITLTFKKGEIVAVNNIKASPIENIKKIEKIASKFGVGRDTHVGDTIIGIKGRVGFEAAAPILIIKAHHLLEKHTLTKWQLIYKEQLCINYGLLLHEGQYLDPVMRDMEEFLISSQKNVSGDVFIKLNPYRYELIGIKSKFDLMDSKFGNYGEMNKKWSADDVKGFIKILSNQNKIYQKINKND